MASDATRQMTNAEINEKLARLCGWDIEKRLSKRVLLICEPGFGSRVFNPCNSLDDCKRVEEQLGVWVEVRPTFNAANAEAAIMFAARYWERSERTTLRWGSGWTEAATEPLARATALAEVER